MSVTAADPFTPERLDRIEAIAAKLDLRQPNKEALQSIVFEIIRHFDIDREPPPFEAVVDVATGVGKTYILAAVIDDLVADGVRNFAVITPGRTILDKTVANFTPGHPKSLLDGLETRPVVITSDNFATPAMRAVMDDPAQVKLFIFTVQALLKPESKAGRKTHKFQEGLGEAFYAHLQHLNDLIVFADEHHAYYGPAFSKAVRDLRPRVLIGLTATPHQKTPPDQIIYRYPLAAAIADKLVKTPVLVGRKDDRTDPETKLRDGARLLELKEEAVARWRQDTGAEAVTPVMLVIAPSIEEANEIERIVTDPGFAHGRYAGQTLTIHSDSPEVALAALDRLEEPGNPYRIVISVGMLKEGWDVKNVYVIASLRASVSQLLTEQTLGRGLRLPFGRYTGIEFLDTLEVLGHEKYEELLKKAGAFNEQFIDWRTRAVLRTNSEGRVVPELETMPVAMPLELVSPVASGASPDSAAVGGPAPAIRSLEDETAEATATVLRLQMTLAPRSDLPPLRIPVLKMTAVKSDFSLADITDLEPFRRLGEHIAAEPSDMLRRVALGAQVVAGPDGQRKTVSVTQRAERTVESRALPLPLTDARQALIDTVLDSPVVPDRPQEVRPAERIVDALLRGLGPDPATMLSAYLSRTRRGLSDLLLSEQRKFAAKPSFQEVVESIAFAPARIGRAETSRDRFGPFQKGIGYLGYQKSPYAQVWFDSSTEREVANLLDDDDANARWVRLQRGDLPILWNDAQEYHPDFIAVDQSGVHWLVEVKMDKEMTSADVAGKREAAQRWANHVSAEPAVGVEWRYLLVSETDVRTAHGSWSALAARGA